MTARVIDSTVKVPVLVPFRILPVSSGGFGGDDHGSPVVPAPLARDSGTFVIRLSVLLSYYYYQRSTCVAGIILVVSSALVSDYIHTGDR